MSSRTLLPWILVAVLVAMLLVNWRASGTKISAPIPTVLIGSQLTPDFEKLGKVFSNQRWEYQCSLGPVSIWRDDSQSMAAIVQGTTAITLFTADSSGKTLTVISKGNHVADYQFDERGNLKSALRYVNIGGTEAWVIDTDDDGVNDRRIMPELKKDEIFEGGAWKPKPVK